MKYLWLDWSTKLPIKGGPGLLLVVGILGIMAAALPKVAIPMFVLMALGAIGGVIAYWRRHR